MFLKGLSLKVAMRFSKRAIPLILASPLLPPRKMPHRPIFIIGCPRSGTTILFRLLTSAPGTASLRQEGHVLWETFHHPREHAWRGGDLDSSDVGWVERRFIAWTIRLLAGGGRFIDKTPRNALRLSYLDALFPDARYVFIYRDGRAIVSSLHKEWSKKKNSRPPYRLPAGFAVTGIPERVWWFVLPRGWQEMNGRTLEEVCAFQYMSCMESMLSFRRSIDPERLIEVKYEQLCEDPAREYKRLLDALDLAADDETLDRARDRVRPLKTPPEPAPEVSRMLPQIQPMLDRTGYGATASLVEAGLEDLAT